MILIYTEDEEGRSPVKILARKIVSGINIKVKWTPKGDLLTNPRKTKARIDVVLAKHADVSGIIICVDTECTSVSEQEIQNAEKKLSEMVEIPVKYCAVVHSLEGWLASDKKMISRRICKEKFDFNAEQICKPKQYLENEFKKAGKDFNYITDNEKLATEADITAIANNNNSFQAFITALTTLQQTVTGQ